AAAGGRRRPGGGVSADAPAGARRVVARENRAHGPQLQASRGTDVHAPHVVTRGSPTPQRILITGAAGLIGTVLMRGLERRYDLVGVDRALRRPPDVRRRNLARARGLAG